MSLPSPAPNSQHIPQSRSTSCIICTDPVDESLQATNSHTGPSPSYSDFRSDSPEPITELPMVDHTSIAATPLGSHPMLTRAKAGIFKTRHQAHLELQPSTLAKTPHSHSRILHQQDSFNLENLFLSGLEKVCFISSPVTGYGEKNQTQEEDENC
ncbi:Reverse transcriptase Ty1/copia-type domain-containing protein [Forsythia ovata]|uniref:Reverse transcriptase Ty1/copia-type domain-containing protein n=1 Tax=Forsythia ovata TaxID=205694 RepID=A0ABD1UY88_9LAMI